MDTTQQPGEAEALLFPSARDSWGLSLGRAKYERAREPVVLLEKRAKLVQEVPEVTPALN